jgi:hypothetical protein
MANSVRYITNEQGERIGVLLDLDDYRQLTRLSATDPDLLQGLSDEELQALAQSALAPADQSRMDDLLALRSHCLAASNPSPVRSSLRLLSDR